VQSSSGRPVRDEDADQRAGQLDLDPLPVGELVVHEAQAQGLQRLAEVRANETERLALVALDGLDGARVPPPLSEGVAPSRSGTAG